MSSKLVLHKTDGSPPVRAVLMTLNILGIKPKIVEVNTLAGETRTPEFLEKNPTHTVPLLEDGELFLSDSHAIIIYLVSKFGADKKDLYPDDLNVRATIHQRLFFDTGILFPKFISVIRHILKDGENGPSPQQIVEIEEAYGMLEKYLEKHRFVANNSLTLADVSIVSTLSTIHLFLPVTDKFPKLLDWHARMQNTDFYQKANKPGLDLLSGFLKMKSQGGSS